MATDLDFVTTDELIAELRKRHKVFFLIAKPLIDEDFDWRLSWEGSSPYEAIGLAMCGVRELTS